MKTLITFIITRIFIILLILGFGYPIWTHVPKNKSMAVEPVEVFEPSFPADIMIVEFKTEIWKYRLFECGTIKKIVVTKRSEYNDRS